MTSPNPLAAIRTVLLDDAEVNAMTGGRIFVPELSDPENRFGLSTTEIQQMPRKCAVIRSTGGGSLGPGARSRVPWVNTRLDIQSFGKTTYEADEVHWAIYAAMVALNRRVAHNTVLYDAIVTGGPIHERDPDTDWPYCIGVYDLSAAWAI